MLVYGDIARVEDAASVRRRIAEHMSACISLPPGRRRHELLFQTFVTTGELAQGLADQEFKQRAADDVSDIHDAGARLLLVQAQSILRSWQASFLGDLVFPAEWPLLLERLDSREPVRMKRAEGYAFYALYPESYIEAALRSGLPSTTVVIGIRSIGMSLAALVAAALDSGPAYSLRPTGHPFSRHLQIGQMLRERILTERDVDFAIVDEGPGLSGSSFGCVADWLLANGVSSRRLHFFPSHKGDLGPHASNAHRQRWNERPKHVVEARELIIDVPEGAHSLQAWVSELVGAHKPSWRELSGGNWRAFRYDDPENWPPSYRQQEKLKFLVSEGDKRWLVKFAGLCEAGADKRRRGALLGKAGFTPMVIGTCYGFIVEPWIDGQPVETSALTKERVVDQIGRYLAFRARYLPAQHGGASLGDLCQMAVSNVGEAIGEDSARQLELLIDRRKYLVQHLQRVDTDNRLHAWEWLLKDDGSLLKTDALDHNGAHDLIGCQDIAWDIAGACVEFDLSSAERTRLAEIIARKVDSELREDVLTVFEASYLGFQIGLWSVASAGDSELETLRVRRTLERYADRLQRLLRT
ncbi:hypothetical protein [Rhizobium sp. BR 362]|uniref:hypothetical protein n=1 Tax=Rhizobium sp. BR 362 TaxID=3040670 RepID=UPI002F40F014